MMKGFLNALCEASHHTGLYLKRNTLPHRSEWLLGIKHNIHTGNVDHCLSFQTNRRMDRTHFNYEISFSPPFKGKTANPVSLNEGKPGVDFAPLVKGAPANHFHPWASSGEVTLVNGVTVASVALLKFATVISVVSCAVSFVYQNWIPGEHCGVTTPQQRFSRRSGSLRTFSFRYLRPTLIWREDNFLIHCANIVTDGFETMEGEEREAAIWYTYTDFVFHNQRFGRGLSIFSRVLTLAVITPVISRIVVYATFQTKRTLVQNVLVTGLTVAIGSWTVQLVATVSGGILVLAFVTIPKVFKATKRH